MKFEDHEMRRVMAEEGTRGRRQPKFAVNLERQRQLRRIARLLEEGNCDREKYAAILLNDLGLSEQSDEFLHYMMAWDQFRQS